jgi:hypothetical protein
MGNRKQSKLSLNRETVRNLGKDGLSRAVGGAFRNNTGEDGCPDRTANTNCASLCATCTCPTLALSCQTCLNATCTCIGNTLPR